MFLLSFQAKGIALKNTKSCFPARLACCDLRPSGSRKSRGAGGLACGESPTRSTRASSMQSRSGSRLLGARLLSRSADGPLFLSGSRQCSRCCGSGFGPGCVLLPFLLAGVLQLQLPLARHPRKSACEAKNVLCCKRLQGPGGRVNEPPSIRKCRSPHGLPWLVRGPAPPGSPAGAPALAPPRGASRAYGTHVLAAQGLKTHVSSN